MWNLTFVYSGLSELSEITGLAAHLLESIGGPLNPDRLDEVRRRWLQ